MPGGLCSCPPGLLGSPALSRPVFCLQASTPACQAQWRPGFPLWALVSCYTGQTSVLTPSGAFGALCLQIPSRHISKHVLPCCWGPGVHEPDCSGLHRRPSLTFPNLPHPRPLPAVTGLPQSPLPSVSLLTLPVCRHADPRQLLSSSDMVSVKAGAGRGPVRVGDQCGSGTGVCASHLPCVRGGELPSLLCVSLSF